MDDARISLIESTLRARGLCAAAELATALGVSQPTMSRLLAAMGKRIVVIGRARATRYALSRDIARAGHRWPLYRIDANGDAQRLGLLTALHGDRFHFDAEQDLPALRHGEFERGLFPGFPWFLDIQRPQGFLGRAFARRIAANIGVPDDLTRWRTDDVVLALLRHGEDEAGDLVLGERNLQLAMTAILTPSDTLDEADRPTLYPRFAEDTLQGENVGSSAGGEQPKFTATLASPEGYRAVIVKFSDRVDTPGGRRWADLLQAEALAGDILRRHGIAAANAQAFEADQRVFLESTRFDRTPSMGRNGLIHLAAIDAAFYGHGNIPWYIFADKLHEDGWIDDDGADMLRIVGWFGELIANNDMHLANIALHLTDQRPFRVAPVYDMLPMRFRPSANGEVVTREYVLRLPLPEQRDDWRVAAAMARAFWEAVSDHPAISGAFRDIASDARRKLDAAIERF